MSLAIDAIQFVGHASVFLRAGDYTIAIDPWLKDNPQCPEAMKNPNRMDVIVVTHGHGDHAGEVADLAVKHGSTVFAIDELAELFHHDGVPEAQLVRMARDKASEKNGLKVSLTRADHRNSYKTKDGVSHELGAPCGVVVQDGSHTIYHAGDTFIYPEMAEIAEQYKPDVAILPVGGHYTMGPEDAAQAAKLCGAKVVIPIHYGTFEVLPGKVEDFLAECDKLGIETWPMKPGETRSLM
ncbi:MAG: metal-dependent hydrolase [Armatimonadetes bacterium]|nr:metal-dependent hydrolase [Armatimonadota bacterium]